MGKGLGHGLGSNPGLRARGGGAAHEKEQFLQDSNPKDLDARKCTDVFCLLIFGIFWMVLIAIWSIIFNLGDERKVFYGIDYEGNVCGTETSRVNLSTSPKIWYPRIAQDVAAQPETFASGFWWDIDLYGVCVEECPKFDPESGVPGSAVKVIPDYGWGVYPDAKAPMWPVLLNTFDVANRCVPTKETTSRSLVLCTMPICTMVHAPCSPLSGSLGIPEGAWEMTKEHPASLCGREINFAYSVDIEQPGSTEYLEWMFYALTKFGETCNAIADNWGTLLGFGVGLTLLLNFSWLVIFYCFARVAVWLSIFVMGLALALGAIFCFVKAGLIGRASLAVQAASYHNLTMSHAPGIAEWDTVSRAGQFLAPVEEDQAGAMAAAALVLLLLLLIFSILICCSCEAIEKCVLLIQMASLTLGRTSGLAIMPLFIVALQLLLLGATLFFLAVLPTVDIAGTMEERIAFSSTSEWHIWVAGAYLVTGAAWTYAFFTAVTLMTVAACVFYFYFVDKKSVPAAAYMEQYDDNQTDYPVVKHLGWVLRYHVGTLAFGSAVVTICVLIQMATSAIFTYLEKNSASNPFLKMISCCISCCLECFKRSIEFVNSYAYIYCFVENVGFCEGSLKTFNLMLKYPAQVAINTSVQRVLSTLLTLSTPLACSLVAFSYFDFLAADAPARTSEGSYLLPLAVFVIALFMTLAFAGVWEQVVQSLTVCVIHDVESFNGRFLRKEMVEAFGNPAKGGELPSSSRLYEKGTINP